MCGLGGRISFVGMADAPTDALTLDIDSFHIKKLSLVGSNHNPCSRLYPTAVELLRRGDVPADTLITHRFALEQIAEAFAFTTTARGEVVKVMITRRRRRCLRRDSP